MRITFLRSALMTAAIVAAAGILAGGLALRPAFAVVGSAMVSPFTTCSNSTSCKSYKNTGTGLGLQGTNTNASYKGVGLLGTSTQGGTGVEGQAVTGVAMLGSSVSGIGVLGTSSSGNGVEGTSHATTSANAGVQGTNDTTTIAVRANGFGGRLFDGNNSSGLDVFTVDDAGNTAIGSSASIVGALGFDAVDAGSFGTNRGVASEGNIGVAGYGVGGTPFGMYASNNGSSGGTALVVQDSSGTGVLINGFDSGGGVKLQVQDDGTVYAHNFVQSFDAPHGQKVTTYATMSSTASVEDFGEAQLTQGQSMVSLKQQFAATIDSRVSYMVFITPEGDTRGLYVAQRTPAGFVVRENQGGRSNAAFSYRIVAKPIGSTNAMLRPAIAPPARLTRPPVIAKLHRVPKTRP